MPEGLTSEEAAKKLEEYGPNEIEKGEETGKLDILLGQFSNVMVWILIAAAAISYITGGMIEFYFILFIIGVIVSMGFFQEWKAEAAIEELKEMARPQATVIRNGEVLEIPSREVVPGDILKLEMGDKVPADAEIIKSVDLRLDESLITGESKAVGKDEDDEIYSGTSIVHGRGEAKVVATGMDTELGEIAGEIQEEETETPLQQKIDDVGKKLGLLALLSSIAIFFIGLGKGAPFAQIMIVTLALAVSAVPEGLPLTLTLTLAIGTRTLADKNAIIRKLVAVEGLGSTTVICTDKTGTLTKNEMTVKKVYVSDKEFDVTGAGYEPLGEIKHEGEQVVLGSHPTLVEVIKAGVLCNNSSLVHDDGYEIRGNPTEGALLTLGHKVGIRKEELEERYPRLDENVFTSKRKMMSTVNRDPEKKHDTSFVKGAPEVVLERCGYIREGNDVVELTQSKRKKLLERNDSYSRDAFRVLALAHKSDVDSHGKDHSEEDLIFLGLVAMKDPPREGARETVKMCKDAGIEIKMVTGDNENTARAIGEEIGLTDNPEVLTGSDLEDMSDEELSERMEEVDIFARTMPRHKYRLVEAFQEKGESVAMTGDGVNDAPAVKKANMGVGMGKKGTDVTKEASDIVLEDDRFETLVTAVKEGRRIFDNIEKLTTYLLSANFTEVIIIAMGMILLPFEYLPLIAVQILFLNLIEEEFPAISLGVDPTESNIMARPPRETDVSILHKRNMFFTVSMAVFMALLGFGIFMWVGPYQNIDLARTAIFTADTFMIVVHAFNFRSLERTLDEIDIFENRWMVISTVVTIAVLPFIIYVPSLAGAFSHVPIGIEFWGLAFLTSIATVIFIEAMKKFSQSYIDTTYMWKINTD